MELYEGRKGRNGNGYNNKCQLNGISNKEMNNILWNMRNTSGCICEKMANKQKKFYLYRIINQKLQNGVHYYDYTMRFQLDTKEGYEMELLAALKADCTELKKWVTYSQYSTKRNMDEQIGKVMITRK